MDIREIVEKVGNASLVVMCGLTGSGKSFIASRLAKQLGFVHLATDTIREELSGQIRYDLAGNEKVGVLSKRAYEEMYRRAEKLLSERKRVVLDGTHLHSEGRKKGIDRILRVVTKDSLVVLVVRAHKKNMTVWMEWKPSMANEKETYYEAWRRVTGYFEEDFKKGICSWPTEAEGIRVVEVWNST